MKDRITYLNGKYIPSSKVGISQYSGFCMYSVCAFEMTRSFNRVHFKLEEHIDRLFDGLKILRLDIKMSKQDMINVCHKVCEKNEKNFNKDDEFRLMINCGMGNLSIYPEPHDPIVICDVFPLSWTVQGMSKLFKTGINAVVTNQRTVPAHIIDPRIKNRSRLHYYMANLEVSGYKGDNNWALLCDENGHIAEGAGANIFIRKGDTVITPKKENVLEGISRQYIIDMIIDWGMEIFEEDINLHDLYTANEAWFSATPFCILPIISFNGITMESDGAFIINDIMATWSRNVGVDIVGQIKKWDKGSKGSTPYQIKGK